jgi:hypothetical protein
MVVLVGAAAFFFLHWKKQTIAAMPIAVAAPLAADVQKVAEGEDYSVSNSVTIVLGDNEERHGLKHIADQKDGQTEVESIEGVSARVLRLTGTRTLLNFYFQIDPAFKQNDLSRVRFEVEYFAPQPGTLDVQYDARGEGDPAKYRKADNGLSLVDGKGWQRATFRTAGDAILSNRQNGRADFRIRARTPLLYVRRVAVTREPPPDEKWRTEFSSSNEVTVLLGQEKPEEDGLRFVTKNSPPTVEVLDGVTCRYLNRMNENRMFGSLYFSISPGFKRAPIKNARVEVEYLGKKDTAFRLQFDGIDGETRRMYQPILPDDARVMRFGTGADYGTIPTPGVWSVATFHITNAVFMNSQRDGADFRIEVVPPELYVRRVTVMREASP